MRSPVAPVPAVDCSKDPIGWIASCGCSHNDQSVRRRNHEARRKSKKGKWLCYLVLGLPLKDSIPTQHHFTAGQGLYSIVSKPHFESPTIKSHCLQLDPFHNMSG